MLSILMLGSGVSAAQEWPSKVRAQAGFLEADTDGDGGLGPVDVAEIAFQVQGQRPSLQQASEWLALADADGDGMLSFAEFWALLKQERQQAEANG